jgi:hypothetical protein
MSSVTKGLDADIGDSFWDWDEHIRRIGELTRILTDAGLIVIAPINGADSFDLKKLRALNHPNDLMVINLGDLVSRDIVPDIELPANPDTKSSLTSVLNLLSERDIIPDYCI